ncbi:hypothetical protein L3C95_32565 [Chitinophaga filiformis]|uniref:hypothetical protein n=1 Tax=Chitinophaga filiformis TaxID=104663 RepID=UPI001F2041E2|nr:hypothetical protein [Chitinophaga filiformis]MCF6407627.1 hypothetical protein [Chitinophaga filiformis]MCF6407668.1 hypothetical protein [Chitinophaga filiformis]
MRNVLVIIALFCAGCLSMKMPEFIPAHSRKVAVKLKDTLGVMTMYIPERYDTGFAWLHHSDCVPCDEMKCRFQPKSSPIKMERSYLWFLPKDSIDQLTIIYHPYPHPYDRPVRKGAHFDRPEIYKDKSRYGDDRENMKFWPPALKCLVLDTTYKIGDRPLFAFGTCEYDPETKRYTYLLKAETCVRTSQIEFECKLITDKQDSISTHFIENAADVLRTIRFSTPLFE